jgi:uncharacterized membrane protein
MSTPTAIPMQVRPSARYLKPFWMGVIFLIACLFVVRYVFRYYLHYNQAGFDEYWHVRGWLLFHITSGMVALLTGPWQFSSRLREWSLATHRVLGRVYLIAVVCGAIAACYLAIRTVEGWSWTLGLIGLAIAWLTTSGMAYYAIRLRQIQIHKEWMIRSYVVTFAFVTFRILYDVPPFSRIGPETERDITYIWASWALPLLATEVILQLRRMRPIAMRKAGPAGA